MNVPVLLQILQKISDEKDMQCFIVGGVPRDKIVGILVKSFNDIDITTGINSPYLAKEFAIKIHKHIPFSMKQAKDGHVAFYFSDLQLDFSSNFISSGVEEMLYKKGVSNPSPFLKEAYSRDFTINTLLMSLDFKKIKDITGEAVKDIENKIIRTCLAPNITFMDNSKRIIRTVYMSTKLDFDVDPSIIEWVKYNKRDAPPVERSYLSRYLDKSLEFDADRTIYLLNKMALWDYVPITQALYPYARRQMRREILNVK